MKWTRFFKYSLPIGIAGIGINAVLFVTNAFYELVAPLLKNNLTAGPFFTFIDNVTFFTPCFFALLFIAYIIAGQCYMKNVYERNYEKETEALTAKNSAIQKELDEKTEFLKHKYYTNCPNCGSVRVENTNICSFCGASLTIEDNVTKDESENKEG